MIDPVPPKHVVPLDARGDPGDPQGGQASDLFAQLLGATAGVPAAAPPLATPAIGAASVLTPELAGSGDAAAHQPAPLARMFNQDGFFGHAGDAPGQALTLPGDDAAAVAELSDPLAVGPAERAEGFQATGRLVGAVAAVAARPDAPALRALQRDSAPAVARGSAMEAHAPAAAGETEAEPVASPQRRTLRASAAARSPLHVALHELENGLEVSARVEGLEEAERRRLRDEIAALLGRHGLSAARIQIHAMPLRESE